MGSQAIADLLDLHEGRLDVPLLDDAAIRELLSTTRRIAIVGASDSQIRPSHGVLLDLRRRIRGRSGQPERGTGRRPDVLPVGDGSGRGDRAGGHRRRVSSGRPVHRAGAGSGRRRRPLPVAPARHRQSGGRPDRDRRGTGGRHGSLHDHRVPPDARRLSRRHHRRSGGSHRWRPRSTCTPNPATTRRSCSCPAIRTAPPGWRRASMAASTAPTLVNANRGLLGYTGTLGGVPVSVQTTMMGTPTTSIVVEELLNLGVHDLHPGRARPAASGARRLGDVVVALAAARRRPGSVASWVAASRPRRPPTMSWSRRSWRQPRGRVDDPRRTGRDLGRLLRPASGRGRPMGHAAAISPPRWRRPRSSCSRCASAARAGRFGPGRS